MRMGVVSGVLAERGAERVMHYTNSTEDIARSRARARRIREAVARGSLDHEWLQISADMDAYADEREREAGR